MIRGYCQTQIHVVILMSTRGQESVRPALGYAIIFTYAVLAMYFQPVICYSFLSLFVYIVVELVMYFFLCFSKLMVENVSFHWFLLHVLYLCQVIYLCIYLFILILSLIFASMLSAISFGITLLWTSGNFVMES